MNNNNDEKLKQEKIKNIIANPRRQDKLSDDKKREFIARLYKVGDERSISHPSSQASRFVSSQERRF